LPTECPWRTSSLINCGWAAAFWPVTKNVAFICLFKSSFNNSDLFVAGAAWASGGWYIYTEAAFSNGNDFVGNEAGYGATPSGLTYFTSNRFGANPTDEWEYRFNINLGYYF